MNVFFYSIKGGQGKTTHAVGYAKHCGATLITNDLDNGTADIYEPILGADHIVTLEPGQSLAGLVKTLGRRDLVFDFGGFVESRIIEAADMADVAVVPLCYQSTADLMPAVKTVSALLPHCPNVSASGTSWTSLIAFRLTASGLASGAIASVSAQRRRSRAAARRRR